MEEPSAFVALTGSMRSGTSLLGHLLQSRGEGRRAHPDLIFDNDESPFVSQLFAAVRKAAVPPLGFGDPFRSVPLSGPVRQAVEEMGFASPGSLSSRLVAEIAAMAPSGPPPKAVGLKRTSMNYELDILRDVFADVRAVFTVRDPRDVFVSHARRLGVEQNSGKALAILSYILANHYMVERLRREQGAALVVRYEDLIAAPAETMRSVIAFAGLDTAHYDFDMLATFAIPSNSSFNEGQGRKFVANKGISEEAVGRYRLHLDPEVGEFVEFMCAPIIDDHGYAPPQGEPRFRDLHRQFVSDLRKRCDAARISTTAVDHRLQEAGVT